MTIDATPRRLYQVQFRDEMDDGEPPRYFIANQLPDGRWHVHGVDRWTYATDELYFHKRVRS